MNRPKGLKTVMTAAVALAAVVFIALVGASSYMLGYSLAPAPDRTDVGASFDRLFADFPDTRPWVDSLRGRQALRDTFVVMPSGERHHAYYVGRGSRKTALVLHGWRDDAVEFFYLARMYEQQLGYNVVMPDLHAHGLSEGEAVAMGWNDRLDVMQWLRTFMTDTMVVHGVSMGAATTMMLSGEDMPDGLSDIRFVADCGYTSVWDEFAGEMDAQFGLPPFPLMYTSSLLCKLRYGWSFGQASPLRQVAKCRHPMLFIHGSNDTFVPTAMVCRLYAAKPAPKRLWVAPGSAHAMSYRDHEAEYTERVRDFLDSR